MPRTTLSQVAFCAGFLFGCAAVHAEAQQGPFCVIRVLDGRPTKADAGDTWRMTSTVHRIPGLPYLIFTPQNRHGQWVIDDDRRFAPYRAPFPRSYLDSNSWVQEPWSGRIIAVPFIYEGDAQAFIRNVGDTNYKSLVGTDSFKSVRFSRPYIVPSSHETLIPASNGIVYVVTGNQLEPWKYSRLLSENGITRPQFAYSAELNATIIIEPDTGVTPRNSNVFVLTGDRIQAIGSVPSGPEGFELSDLTDERSSLLKMSRAVARIDADDAAEGKPRFSLHAIFHKTSSPAIFDFATSHRFNTQLHIGSPELTVGSQSADPPGHPLTTFWAWIAGHGKLPRSDALQNKTWYHVTRRGIAEIPGGRFRNLEILAASSFAFKEFPEINLTVIDGGDGLYLYDGKALTRVNETPPESVGRFKTFAGAKSIGRLVFRSEKGLFELSSSGPRRLTAPELSLPDYEIIAITDWPAAHVVLVATTQGLVALDKELNATLIDRSVTFDNANNFVGENPNSGDMIVNSRASVMTVVDTARHGSNICNRTNEVSR